MKMQDLIGNKMIVGINTGGAVAITEAKLTDVAQRGENTALKFEFEDTSNRELNSGATSAPKITERWFDLRQCMIYRVEPKIEVV